MFQRSAVRVSWWRRSSVWLPLGLCFVLGLGISSSAAAGTGKPRQGLLAATDDSTCRWSEPTGNTAYPETHARYFKLALPRVRPSGLRLRLDGIYLSARYFSFQLYGAAFNALDALADYEITPAAGSQTPFVGITRIDPAVAPGGRYTVYVEFRAAPARRAPNTLYAGDLVLPGGQPQLYLRAYLSQGTLRLPKVSYESGRGPLLQGLLSPQPTCVDDGGNVAKASAKAANDSAPASSDALLLPAAGSREVKFEVYRGVVGGVAGSGVVYNQNAGFMSATLRRGNELVLVRGRAPSFPGNRQPVPDVRYWSLCQNRKLSQAVVACVADREAAIDPSGFHYTVISTGPGRPAGADAAHGFAFLPSAGLEAGYLIYRQILARPDFVGAISRVPERGDPVVVLGDYAPVGTYCRSSVFAESVAAGRSPARVFADCQAAG